MTKREAIKLFEERKVRSSWDSEEGKWYFSIVDVVEILTDTERPRKYWGDLKKKLNDEGSEVSAKIGQFKMRAADGKMRLTDVADIEQMLRIIQSIPSPKAEPFKLWMANVASTRLDQMQDPELAINQAMADYKRLGYPDAWINQRLKSIEVRKELTDEWKRIGVEEGVQYATLTDIITKEWSGLRVKEYKQYKGLKKQNLRDNMTNVELALNTLAEASATELSKQKNPHGFNENVSIAREGGSVAKAARRELESKLGKSVISSANAQGLLPEND